MTSTTTNNMTSRPVWLVEPFANYAFDADAASARTDTPDLMRVFRDTQLTREAYEDTEAAALEAHADLGVLSERAIPEY